MERHVRREREKVTNVLDYAYSGVSDAHEAAEHIVAAAEDLVCVLATPKLGRYKKRCLRHLRQARLWLATADLGDLDRAARWSMVVRLDVCLCLLGEWQLAREEETAFSRGLDAAARELATIAYGLYHFTDHVQRLFDAQDISRWTRARLLRGMEPEGEPLTCDDLALSTRRLHSIIAQLPDSQERRSAPDSLH